jgi:regulator of Ty1 transposition protein 103
VFDSSLNVVVLLSISQANDVVQNSKRKYPEFANEFGPVMKKVLENLALAKLDEKTIKSIARLLSIWQERSIFEVKIQTDLQVTRPSLL